MHIFKFFRVRVHVPLVLLPMRMVNFFGGRRTVNECVCLEIVVIIRYTN